CPHLRHPQGCRPPPRPPLVRGLRHRCPPPQSPRLPRRPQQCRRLHYRPYQPHPPRRPRAACPALHLWRSSGRRPRHGRCSPRSTHPSRTHPVQSVHGVRPPLSAALRFTAPAHTARTPPRTAAPSPAPSQSAGARTTPARSLPRTPRLPHSAPPPDTPPCLRL